MTTTVLEREIKLRFSDAAIARAAVVAAGAVPLRARRLQQDALLDTAGGLVRSRRSALRVRIESGGASLTFKGPLRPSLMKLREELETKVGDGPLLLRLFEQLGFRVWFRYEKYREEFQATNVIIAVDETPIGTFVEIEGREDGITAMAAALGRAADDYLLDSYRSLFERDCLDRGVPSTDMLFEGPSCSPFRDTRCC